MGLLALTSILVAGTGAFLLGRLWSNRSPGERRIQKDIQELREMLNPLRKQLVPLQGNELELLSRAARKEKDSRGFKKVRLATFTTIYDEPVLTYGYRRYLSAPNALLIGYTQQHEFIYWVRSKGSRLVIDEVFAGLMGPDGVLWEGPKKKTARAAIEPRENGLDRLMIGGREVATLSPPKEEDTPVQPRVFELVVSGLSPEEHRLLWALTLYDLVQPLGATA